MTNQTHIIALVGAKEGVGTTSIASNLACALSDIGIPASLVDMDFNNSGDLSFVMENVDEKINIIPRSVCQDYGSLKKSLKNSSFLIVDIGANFCNDNVWMLRCAEQIHLVTTPCPLSINAAWRKLSLFKQALLSLEDIHLIINNISPYDIMDVQLILEKLSIDLTAGFKSYPEIMSKALQRGRPAFMIEKKHNLRTEFESYATKLINSRFNRQPFSSLDMVKLIVSSPTANKSASEVKSLQDIKKENANNVLKTGLVDNSLKEFKEELLNELISTLKINKDNLSNADYIDLLKSKAQEQLIDIMDKRQTPKEIVRKDIIKEIIANAIGMGPLEDLMLDPEISEVMINGPDTIYVEKKGKLALSGRSFLNDKTLDLTIDRIVTPLGRRIDESSPMVDARLKDGSRVNIIIPPLSLNGVTITVRKFFDGGLTSADLIKMGSANTCMVDFLAAAVKSKLNILVSGGTGSGKTTLLNMLASFIPSDERIITIEDAAELKLGQPHCVRLETRPPNIEGDGEITTRDLVKNSLRMRPDRIIVGECRGGEALDMLQAMNTGHDGSLTTIHANSPRDSLSRLETLVLFSGIDLPTRAIREQIASAIDIIVQIERLSDGSRKITEIAEVAGMEGDVITTQELFRFEPKSDNKGTKSEGDFIYTGLMPRCMAKIAQRGISVSGLRCQPSVPGLSPALIKE